jgi:hypothetical protein
MSHGRVRNLSPEFIKNILLNLPPAADPNALFDQQNVTDGTCLGGPPLFFLYTFSFLPFPSSHPFSPLLPILLPHFFTNARLRL